VDGSVDTHRGFCDKYRLMKKTRRNGKERDTEVFSVRLQKALVSRLRIAAEKDRRTMANLATVLIENGLTNIERGLQ
jgi:hypothetical protein